MTKNQFLLTNFELVTKNRFLLTKPWFLLTKKQCLLTKDHFYWLTLIYYLAFRPRGAEPKYLNNFWPLNLLNNHWWFIRKALYSYTFEAGRRSRGSDIGPQGTVIWTLWKSIKTLRKPCAFGLKSYWLTSID